MPYIINNNIKVLIILNKSAINAPRYKANFIYTIEA